MSIQIPGTKIHVVRSEVIAPTHIIISSRGSGRSGKTHFATTLPEPIGWLPFDPNSRSVVNSLIESQGKDIFLPTEDLSRQADFVANLTVEAAIKHYSEQMGEIRKLYEWMMKSPDIKSVVVDTGGQLWEDIMFMHFGRKLRVQARDLGAPRGTMKDWFVGPATKPILFIHHAKPKWVNDNPVPGEWETEGCSKLRDWVGVEIHHFHLTTEAVVQDMRVRFGGQHPDNDGGKSWRRGQFGFILLNSSARMDLANKVYIGDDANFITLMSDLDPAMLDQWL